MPQDGWQGRGLQGWAFRGNQAGKKGQLEVNSKWNNKNVTQLKIGTQCGHWIDPTLLPPHYASSTIMSDKLIMAEIEKFDKSHLKKRMQAKKPLLLKETIKQEKQICHQGALCCTVIAFLFYYS